MAPPGMRILIIATIALAVLFAANAVYQLLRKPTEMFFPVSGTMNKIPAETWRQYAPLFRALLPALLGDSCWGSDTKSRGRDRRRACYRCRKAAEAELRLGLRAGSNATVIGCGKPIGYRAGKILTHLCAF